MTKYHLRCPTFGEAILDSDHRKVEIEGLERALFIALQYSSQDSNQLVMVCEETPSGYRQVAIVGAGD